MSSRFASPALGDHRKTGPAQAEVSGFRAEQVTLLRKLTRTSGRLFEVFARESDFALPTQGQSGTPEAPTPSEPPSSTGFASGVRQLLKLRAARRRTSLEGLFDWPAWDILLDLAAVRADESHVSVSSVCISSGAPQSTALRKLAALERAEFVQRYEHGTDGRRVHVRLTDGGLEVVDRALSEEFALYRNIQAFRAA
jgi:DNA-binding MarR family transcriptional regulator